MFTSDNYVLEQAQSVVPVSDWQPQATGEASGSTGSENASAGDVANFRMALIIVGLAWAILIATHTVVLRGHIL